jgi:CRISPR-associated protein Cas1
MIQNPAKLSLRKTQLNVSNDEGDFTLPLEDVTALVLESPQVTLTSSLLAACQENGVAVVTCDETHMPNGVLLPFHPHSRQSRVAQVQMSWSESLRKRLWQRIIQSKITNQADCLDQCVGATESIRLRALIGRVGSGDPDNIEAQAAREYWPRLFGKDFRRGEGGTINAALNYGYAVLRAFVARSQVSYGLLPAFGLHHSNELNAFNLTDDVMEVFRPFVDLQVFDLLKGGQIEPNALSLPASVRQTLASIGSRTCSYDGQIHTIANASDKMAAALVSAIEARTPALFVMPGHSPQGTNEDDP